MSTLAMSTPEQIVTELSPLWNGYWLYSAGMIEAQFAVQRLDEKLEALDTPDARLLLAKQNEALYKRFERLPEGLNGHVGQVAEVYAEWAARTTERLYPSNLQLTEEALAARALSARTIHRLALCAQDTGGRADSTDSLQSVVASFKANQAALSLLQPTAGHPSADTRDLIGRIRRGMHAAADTLATAARDLGNAFGAMSGSTADTGRLLVDVVSTFTAGFGTRALQTSAHAAQR